MRRVQKGVVMDYNDRELLDLIAEHNEDALQIMYKKYEPYLVTQARTFYNSAPYVGLEVSDFRQEGMIALTEAIQSYDMNLNVTFFTYATTCIQTRMISSLIGAKRQKHKILNESVPLEQKTSDGSELSLDNFLVNDNMNPERVVMNADYMEQLFRNLKNELTDFEYQVFELKYNDFSYQEIANLLEKDVKAIDNAFQRIRSKATKMLAKEKKEEKN